MMQEIRIAIPSYKRSKTVKQKTLNYLINICNYPADLIDIFVANEQEFEIYKTDLSGLNVNIIIGKETLRGQRNFIDFYYKKGQCILNFDDDIEGIYKRQNSKQLKIFTNLKALAAIGFNECIKNNTAIFGICAVNNAFFMSAKITYNLKYIVGCFFGQIITHDKNLSVSLEDKEDFERTILYFHKYKKIVRLNMFAPKTLYYKEDGGMQVTRTDERVTKSALALVKKYPQYCKINKGKKSSHTEVKLISTAK